MLKFVNITTMPDNERLKNVLEYLKNNRYVRNQQEFCERINIHKSTMSEILNGHKQIQNKVFIAIEHEFPFIDTKWIRSGEGEMLKSTNTQNVFGGEKITQTGNIHAVDSEVLIKTLEEFSEIRQMLDTALQSNIRITQQVASTNDRLMTLLEKLYDK